MRDLSRAKPASQPDADGTRAEDDRQLTDLLLRNKVSIRPTPAESVGAKSTQPLVSRIVTWLILCVALPVFLLAYFSSRTDEDDFYA
ncbi:hypothetical protein [Neorhizobium sp. JUb45]|uniref:hypothetical protein n=1 Tax=unclassified Neorhizobium TaxID=2629175 RepID=UPI0010511062|nr:hypothetical protein [Neorhizobium sp. JUb45]TCR01872.1 hypothetical protein EDF70_104145 [Neorhizobium sp. JUb45]